MVLSIRQLIFSLNQDKYLRPKKGDLSFICSLQKVGNFYKTNTYTNTYTQENDKYSEIENNSYNDNQIFKKDNA